jgi:hypothetical protein
MYKSHVVSTDYWRHFVPHAPDLELTVVMGEPSSISLRDVMIQGARDLETGESPDPTVLPVRVPVQRGWLLNLVIANQPPLAVARVSPDGWGIEVETNSVQSVMSCFNYQLSNGIQLSNFGQITYTYIIPFPLQMFITVFDRNVFLIGATEGTFKFGINPLSAYQGYYRSEMFSYHWHVVRPAVVETIGGTNYIDMVDTVIYQSTFLILNKEFIMIDPALEIADVHLTTDYDLVGIDRRTGLPYIPNHRFPSVYVEHREYNTLKPDGSPDLDVYDRFNHYIERYHGVKWWRSSRIST